MANSKKIYINLVDNSFLQTLGVQVLAGRLFSKDFPADTLTRFVINEEAVKQFGFRTPQDAVGKWMAFNVEGQSHQFTIIGVVKNFHFKDLHENIEPFAFRMYNDADFNYLVARSKGDNIKQSLAGLEGTWKKLNPNEPFEYSFLDQDFQKNYEAEDRQASLINYFTMMIVVPCSFKSVSNCITSLPFEESRFPVGSSARINLGLFTTARATATRCCCPPESCCG